MLKGFAFTMIVGIITGHLLERVHRRGHRRHLAGTGAAEGRAAAAPTAPARKSGKRARAS